MDKFFSCLFALAANVLDQLNVIGWWIRWRQKKALIDQITISLFYSTFNWKVNVVHKCSLLFQDIRAFFIAKTSQKQKLHWFQQWQCEKIVGHFDQFFWPWTSLFLHWKRQLNDGLLKSLATPLPKPNEDNKTFFLLIRLPRPIIRFQISSRKGTRILTSLMQT